MSGGDVPFLARLLHFLRACGCFFLVWHGHYVCGKYLGWVHYQNDAALGCCLRQTPYSSNSPICWPYQPHSDPVLGAYATHSFLVVLICKKLSTFDGWATRVLALNIAFCWSCSAERMTTFRCSRCCLLYGGKTAPKNLPYFEGHSPEGGSPRTQACKLGKPGLAQLKVRLPI